MTDPRADACRDLIEPTAEPEPEDEDSPKLAHHRNPGPAKARAALHQALGSTNND